MTVEPGSCGPVVRWDALQERWIEWSHCEPDFAIEATVEYHEWFGIPDTEHESCGLHRPVFAAGEVLCRAEGSTESYRVEVIGQETLSVAGVDLDTVHVRRVSDLSDGSTGSTVAEVWRLTGTALIVRAEWESTSVTPSPAGEVIYTEVVVLELLDPLPMGAG
jgi:hypothetical protein